MTRKHPQPTASFPTALSNDDAYSAKTGTLLAKGSAISLAPAEYIPTLIDNYAEIKRQREILLDSMSRLDYYDDAYQSLEREPSKMIDLYKKNFETVDQLKPPLNFTSLQTMVCGLLPNGHK